MADFKPTAWLRRSSVLALGLLALSAFGSISSAFADAPPDLETRVADLEAYMNNVAPKGTPIAGPGHNAWMMTCSALVLFMTLPGLALFYGGLVRKKNILSV